MNKKLKISLISSIILIITFLLIAGEFLYYKYLFWKSVTIEEMKHCTSSEECVPVGCICRCSGCGGFSSEDVVNKKYVEAWYYKKGCKPPEICPMVCCKPVTIECENNLCVVKPLKME